MEPSLDSTLSPSGPPGIADRVRFDIVRSHYDLTPQPVWAGLAFSTLLAWAVVPSAGLHLAVGWLAFKWLFGSIRLVEGLRFRQDAQRRQRAEHWYARYFWLMVIDGSSWGAIGVMFVPSGTAALDGVLLCSVAGVAAAGLFTVIGSFRSSFVFLSLALLPSVGYHLGHGTHAGWLAGLGLLIYWGVLVFEAWRGEQVFTELIRLRHHNEWIADQHHGAMVLAEQSSAAKSRFLATVSHEVRTPLNGILGMAQLLQRSTLDAAQREQIDVVAQSARHLRTIIDDILDMARIESGRLHVEPSPFDLRATVHEVTAVLAPLAHDKSLAFDVAFDPGLAPAWLGDAARIRQVLHNLIGNAIKFTSRGAVRLAVAPAAQGLCFAVSDTGPGIPAEARRRIFEPFEQASQGTARPSAGTGLGLTIARQLARTMGGDVVCTATSDGGSTFVFELVAEPVIGGLGESRDGDPPPPGALAGARVLLVEDNPVNAIVALAMLERFGLHATQAINGEEALQRLSAEQFDLVLMDCQMPGLDGFETTRRWRAHEAATTDGTRVPIVAVTANAAAGDRERCLGAGMDDYLAKPFEMPDLQVVVHRHLGAERVSP